MVLDNIICQVQTLAENGDRDISNSDVWKVLVRFARVGEQTLKCYETHDGSLHAFGERIETVCELSAFW